MAHDHDHQHNHGHDHTRAPQVIVRAIGITVVFMLIELIGGYFSNSLALISDGAHMLTDVGAMLLSLFAIWVSRRPSTSRMSFGYHRAEILGALGSGLLIWMISGLLIFEAILRLRNPPPVQGATVFVIATIGLFANILCMRMLHHARDDNMNVRAAYLHMLSDALGSIGAIVAGLVIWLTGWRPIDPIITFFFAILMLYSSFSLVKEAVGILMESTPPGIDAEQVRRDLQALASVQEAHDLHIWTVSSGRLALSVHLIANGPEDVLNPAMEMLETRYKIVHTTIQVERPDEFQSERCYDCGPPSAS